MSREEAIAKEKVILFEFDEPPFQWVGEVKAKQTYQNASIYGSKLGQMSDAKLFLLEVFY